MYLIDFDNAHLAFGHLGDIVDCCINHDRTFSKITSFQASTIHDSIIGINDIWRDSVVANSPDAQSGVPGFDPRKISTCPGLTSLYGGDKLVPFSDGVDSTLWVWHKARTFNFNLNFNDGSGFGGN